MSYPSTEQICPAGSPPSSPPALYAVHYCSPGGQELTSSTLYRNRDNHLRVTGQRMSGSRHSRRSSSCDSSSVAAERDMSPSPSSAIYEESNKPKAQRKMGKRNIKAQVKKFRMETKAAKTLGIIVGGFIFCWLPFFTMYLIRAFCEKCIHPLVFSILFWLGYCNSAINPLIYALFSKDFRFAFKRIICRCLCNRVKSTDQSRRGSDGSQMKACKSPSYNRQPQHNSLGEDSDPAVEGSDSRWRKDTSFRGEKSNGKLANGSFKWNGSVDNEPTVESLKEKKQQYNLAVYRYGDLLKELEQLREHKGNEENKELVFVEQFLSPGEMKTHKRLCNRILKTLTLELEDMQKIDDVKQLDMPYHKNAKRNDLLCQTSVKKSLLTDINAFPKNGVDMPNRSLNES